MTSTTTTLSNRKAAHALTDAQLFAAVGRGDEDAAAVLYKRESTGVRNYFRARVMCKADVDDLVTTVFAQAALAARKHALTGPARPLLMCIARHRLGKYAAECHRTTRQEEDVLRPTRIPTPEEALLLAEERGLAVRALRRLSERQQRAVQLAYWEETPIAEIAHDIGVGRDTASQVLCEARAELRSILGAPRPAQKAKAPAVAYNARPREPIMAALERSRGNMTVAARELGMTYIQLTGWLKYHKINVRSFPWYVSTEPARHEAQARIHLAAAINDGITREALEAALEKARGVVAHAGKALGVERTRLRGWIKRLGIDLDGYRARFQRAA